MDLHAPQPTTQLLSWTAEDPLHLAWLTQQARQYAQTAQRQLQEQRTNEDGAPTLAELALLRQTGLHRTQAQVRLYQEQALAFVQCWDAAFAAAWSQTARPARGVADTVVPGTSDLSPDWYCPGCGRTTCVCRPLDGFLNTLGDAHGDDDDESPF